MTTASGGLPAGVTANSFSSVSLDPPLVLWSISRRSRSFTAFEAADFFAINIRSSTQIHLAQRFSSQERDKFAGVAWSPGAGGSPLIAGAVAHLECRRESAHEGGDHRIIVGRVTRLATFNAEALLFVQGRYGVAEDHPDVRGVEAAGDGGGLPPDTPFLTLMFQAITPFPAVSKSIAPLKASLARRCAR